MNDQILAYIEFSGSSDGDLASYVIKLSNGHDRDLINLGTFLVGPRKHAAGDPSL